MTRDFPDRLYHYTSTAGFYGLIQGRTLWASATHHLNDFKEGRIFAERIEVLGKQLAVSPSKTTEVLKALQDYDCFLTCFSAKGDLLSQWHLYADRGQGVCIGFDTKQLVSLVSGDPRALIRPVAYLSPADTLPVDATDVGAAMLRSNGVPSEAGLVSAAKKLWEFKDAGFSQESEYRMMVTPYQADGASFELASTARVERKHRQVQEGLREYLQVSLESVWPAAITQVILGPKNDSNPPAVKRFLQSCGVGTVEVTRSTIPYI